MMIDGMTLEEAKTILEDWREYSKRRSINGKFLYVKLIDLYEDIPTNHIICKDKLHIWLKDLPSTAETAYIYEVVEDSDGELIKGKWIKNVGLNKL